MQGTRKEEGSVTKSDLIEIVAQKLHLPKGKAELIVNCVFDSMEESLKKGERIEIRGFGSFEIRHYKADEGRNPRTGDPVGVQPKRLPFFKVGKELKERVNEAAQKSNAVLKELGPDIQWQESFVAADKTFCVYLAKDEAVIRKHAELSGFPASKITEVRKMIDPTTERDT